MAEAIFIDRNPEWLYVKKPNAPQHDVYRTILGQSRVYGQIKYHDDLDPSQYARDMIDDNRSKRFFIPDDHVEPTKAYLESKKRMKDYARVRPIGATSAEIRTATTQAQPGPSLASTTRCIRRWVLALRSRLRRPCMSWQPDTGCQGSRPMISAGL